jgi:hypothetical protein
MAGFAQPNRGRLDPAGGESPPPPGSPASTPSHVHSLHCTPAGQGG